MALVSSRDAVFESEPNDEGQRLPRLRDPSYSQSLERGLAILGCFTAERPVLGISDIAEQLGISRTSIHRYAITLRALGYLEQAPSRKYRLGLRVTDLGLSVVNATPLREHSHHYLEDLRRDTSYTVSLAMLDGTDILYVDRARSFRSGQANIDLGIGLGSRLPAYCTSAGKVLLAYLPDHERDMRVSELQLARRAPNTITSKSALRAELEQVREEGFAVNDEELAEELISVAVPVRDSSGEVIAALNLAAHTSMISLTSLVDALLPHLVATADRISARLGYRRDDETARAS
jgi:IclR family transcriptional regulator, pca regulon regulatory protein